MLRWICGVTKKDKIRNENVKGSVKLAPMTKTVAETYQPRQDKRKRLKE